MELEIEQALIVGKLNQNKVTLIVFVLFYFFNFCYIFCFACFVLFFFFCGNFVGLTVNLNYEVIDAVFLV